MRKKRVVNNSKNISLTIIIVTIILAIFLSFIISFLTLNFSANSAESLDTGKVIVRIVPTTSIQEGRITVEINDKPVITNNGK